MPTKSQKLYTDTYQKVMEYVDTYQLPLKGSSGINFPDAIDSEFEDKDSDLNDEDSKMASLLSSIARNTIKKSKPEIDEETLNKLDHGIKSSFKSMKKDSIFGKISMYLKNHYAMAFLLESVVSVFLIQPFLKKYGEKIGTIQKDDKNE